MLLGDLDRCRSLATRPTSLRPRSSSIRCSARSFGSAISSAARRCPPRRRAAPARAGERADGDLAVAHAHQDLRAGADHGEAAEIEEEQERRGVEPAQRAIERERRQPERRGESARRHDLEDVAGADIFLRRLDHRAGIARASCWTAGAASSCVACRALAPVRQVALEVGDHVGQALQRARRRRRARRQLVAGPDRRHHGDACRRCCRRSRSRSGAGRARRACRACRGSCRADALRPARPCRSPYSRTGPPPSAAAPPGISMRFGDQRAQRVERARSGAARTRRDRCGRARLISALSPRQRQIRSGLMPMME